MKKRPRLQKVLLVGGGGGSVGAVSVMWRYAHPQTKQKRQMFGEGWGEKFNARKLSTCAVHAALPPKVSAPRAVQ